MTFLLGKCGVREIKANETLSLPYLEDCGLLGYVTRLGVLLSCRFWLAGLRRSLRVCISHKHPVVSDAAAAGFLNRLGVMVAYSESRECSQILCVDHWSQGSRGSRERRRRALGEARTLFVDLPKLFRSPCSMPFLPTSIWPWAWPGWVWRQQHDSWANQKTILKSFLVLEAEQSQASLKS